METIYKEIAQYQPFNQQEVRDKEWFLKTLSKEENLLTRDNIKHHFTVSAWVVNDAFDEVLMVYHNIYQSYSWIGGHNDGDADMIAVAKKELEEETGIKKYHLLSPEIFAFDILPVVQHMKKGKVIAAHWHINITYLFMADKQPLRIKADENQDVAWIKIKDLHHMVSEQEMLPCYDKLVCKASLYQKEKKCIG